MVIMLMVIVKLVLVTLVRLIAVVNYCNVYHPFIFTY